MNRPDLFQRTRRRRPRIGFPLDRLGNPRAWRSARRLASPAVLACGWLLGVASLAAPAALADPPASDDPAAVDGALKTEDLPEPSINTATGVRWYRDLAYVDGPEADDEKHRLDLYLPKEDTWREGRPLLIWIHGGAWRLGDRNDAGGIYGRLCRRFAEQGIAAANVSYRLSPAVQHPSHVEDVAAAIAWLVSRAETLGFAPDRIIVSGHSAGGHLAALVALDGRYLRAVDVDPAVIIGVVPSSGVFDLQPLFGIGGGRGGGQVFPRGSVRSASPVTHVRADAPPFLLFVEEHGRSMQAQTELMASALGRVGVSAELVVMPGVNHITMIADFARATGLTVSRTVAFIDALSAAKSEVMSGDDSGG